MFLFTGLSAAGFNLGAGGSVVGPQVEFFNPKLRHELEKKDADVMKKTGLKGAAPGGDSWVWLTSYSRIPVSLFLFSEKKKRKIILDLQK